MRGADAATDVDVVRVGVGWGVVAVDDGVVVSTVLGEGENETRPVSEGPLALGLGLGLGLAWGWKGMFV